MTVKLEADILSVRLLHDACVWCLCVCFQQVLLISSHLRRPSHVTASNMAAAG